MKKFILKLIQSKLYKNSLFIFTTLGILSSFSSCLRYVPPISELEKSSKNSKSERINGKNEFISFQKAYDQKLQTLIKQRTGLIENNLGQASYAIGAGDLIEVQVFDVPELNATERVGLDGKLNLPLIGTIEAGGLSIDELRKKLIGEYNTYVRFPKVNVSIKEYEAHRVFVMGAVSRPGAYPLKRKGYLLLEVLSEAGGRTENAGSKVTIIPKLNSNLPSNSNSAQLITQPNSNNIELDLDNFIGSADNQQLMLPLIAGDTIIVAEQGTVQVDGEVSKPGSYKLSPRTTVSGAIAAAGGLTYSANVNSVELIRDFGSGKKATTSLDLEKIALNGTSDFKLRDGDLIRIPSDSGRFKTRQVVEVLNSFFRIGVSGNVR